MFFFVFVLHEHSKYIFVDPLVPSVHSWTFSPFFLQKEGVPLNKFDFNQKKDFFLTFLC